MDKLSLSWDDVYRRLDNLSGIYEPIYGIPRGGSIVAGLLGARSTLQIVSSPEEANFCLDDIIDSGRTRDYYHETYNLPTIALVDKQVEGLIDTWIEFPWEISEGPPRFIRESPIATFDDRFEIEYRPLICPLEEKETLHLLIYFTRGLGREPNHNPYHFCTKCLLSIYTMTPENPVVWRPSRTATANIERQRKKRVTVNLASLAQSNPKIARALEASKLNDKRERGENLTVKGFQLWKEHFK